VISLTTPYVPVYSTGAAALCFEHALVLEALGFDYELRADGTALEVCVPPEDAERALAELDAYRRENAPAPPVPILALHGGGARGVLAYVLVLLAVTWLDDRAALGRDWYAFGRMDAGRLLAGEWWRAFTALTLHADAGHLLGNLVFGAAFGYAAGQVLGAGAAWLTIVVAAGAGNAINALVQPATHTSVGASTAVFAALGIVSAYVWRRQGPSGRTWAQRWAALIAGAVLLAFLGTGDERTDIVAHLTGFASGALAGWVWSILGAHAPGPTSQRLLAIAAFVLMAGAWTAALWRTVPAPF
jgi:rhomboid protease GluP